MTLSPRELIIKRLAYLAPRVEGHDPDCQCRPCHDPLLAKLVALYFRTGGPLGQARLEEYLP